MPSHCLLFAQKQEGYKTLLWLLIMWKVYPKPFLRLKGLQWFDPHYFPGFILCFSSPVSTPFDQPVIPFAHILPCALTFLPETLAWFAPSFHSGLCSIIPQRGVLTSSRTAALPSLPPPIILLTKFIPSFCIILAQLSFPRNTYSPYVFVRNHIDSPNGL